MERTILLQHKLLARVHPLARTSEDATLLIEWALTLKGEALPFAS